MAEANNAPAITSHILGWASWLQPRLPKKTHQQISRWTFISLRERAKFVDDFEVTSSSCQSSHWNIKMKGERLRSTLGLFLRANSFLRAGQIRQLHKTRPAPPIPAPRPFVPDVPTFLTLIGRGLNKYANKFPSWDALFSLTSPQLKELGIEPPRNRRYLLHWMQRYREGALGPGGDFQYVKDGQAFLKVATPPPSVLSEAKWVVNVPHAEDAAETPVTELVRPKGYSVRGQESISGPYAAPLPGLSGAVVKVTEGMWENRRGRKIDGGERRRAEVRFKKRSAERRAEREAEIMANL